MLKYQEIKLTNIAPNPSFEKNEAWNGNYYDESEYLFGNRSFKFPNTDAPYALMAKPIANHKYYGRAYAKSTGQTAPIDSRYEYWGGDVVNGQIIFFQYIGNYPEWTMLSSIREFQAVADLPQFYIRNFHLDSGGASVWCDGLMLIDLTEAFGAGNEPTKEWCDANIPFFESETVISYPVEFELITDRTAEDAANATVKGTYTDIDMNRVQNAVAFLRDTLTGYGYAVPTLFAMPDWLEKSIPSVEQFAEYLANVRTVRDVLKVSHAVPDSMTKLTYSGANDIEKALLAVEDAIHRMELAFIPCGEAICGGDNL